MTDQEINVAVAELLGISRADIDAYLDWREAKRQFECGEIQEAEFYRRHLRVDPEPISVPDYVNDLNAMHEAEQLLARNGHTQTEIRSFYTRMLLKVVGSLNPELPWLVATATARQRAEAFLRTLGKWKEQP